MASQGAPIKRANENFHKYCDALRVVVKNKFFLVYSWLYRGGDRYVGDYFKEIMDKRKEENEKAKSKKKKGVAKLEPIIRVNSDEEAAFELKKSSADFDISFLYKLIHPTCGLRSLSDCTDGCTNPGTPEDQICIEHLLKVLKDKRNDVSHDDSLFDMSGTELDARFDEVSRLCDLLFRKAAAVVGKPPNDLDVAIATMKKDLQDIKTKPRPSGITAEEFAVISKNELTGNHIPSQSTKDFIMPCLEQKRKTEIIHRNLKDFVGWSYSDDSYPFAIVIEGESGTGKTAISRYIYDSWISSSAAITDLRDFHVVIPVQCSNIKTNDLEEFLRRLMKDTIDSCRGEALSFIKALRVLWLIDGFEESTKLATELLQKISKLSQEASHLIIVTTQPQRYQDLFDGIFSLEDNVCKIYHQGLSDKGIKHFLSKKLNITEIIGFLTCIRSHGSYLLEQLKIPLKLSLIMELWQEGRLKSESGESVYFLYDAVLEVHKAKIKEKVKIESKLKDNEIDKRIESLMNALFKVAFDMILNNDFMNIDESYQEELENEAEKLIYPEDCLSLFLQCETTKIPHSYSFIHNTQHIHLASRHMTALITKAGTLPHEIRELFQNKTASPDEHSQYFLYHLLLQVVFHVAKQENVKRSVVKNMVELLKFFGNEFSAFQVVQVAAYHPVFTEEASKFSGEEWRIMSDMIKPAIAILEYVTPLEIDLRIERDPKNLKYILLQLLSSIAQKDLNLHLTLCAHSWDSFHDGVSDDYLDNICSYDAKCHLVKFVGNLSGDGMEKLERKNEVRHLSLQVSSNYVLHAVLAKLNNLEKLEHLMLRLEIPVVTSPPPDFAKLSITRMSVALSFMDERKVRETASAIASFSDHYEDIHVQNIHLDAAFNFIQILQERGIAMNAFYRHLSCDQYNVNGFYVVNYGSVQDLDVFRLQWGSTYLNTYSDDLGTERLSLITNGDLLDSVQYYGARSADNVAVGMATKRTTVLFYNLVEAIHSVAWKTIHQVILWLCPGGNQNVNDYIMRLLNSRGCLTMLSVLMGALETNAPLENFDITMLYQIFLFCCSLDVDNESFGSNSNLRLIIKLLKDKRNWLCHASDLTNITQEEFDSHVDELRWLCEIATLEAGRKANRPTEEVEQFVADIDRNLNSLTKGPEVSGAIQSSGDRHSDSSGHQGNRHQLL